MTAIAWAAEELQYADLGDVRRNKRLMKLVSDLASQPNASVPQASGDWAATQGAYDFWRSPHVKPEAIRQAHQTSTIERVKQQAVVIAIQDTTELNFTHHPSKKGMGYLDNAAASGLKVHSVLCSTEGGVPLGVVHQQVWHRDPTELGKKHQRHKKPIQDKESQRWLSALALTQSLIAGLRWYSYRWLIERYHYVLKSGCRLEQLQLDSADRIHRALATYTIVAWRLLWITYLARYQPDIPADTVLETHEWQALYCTIHQTPLPPDTPPNLRTCVRWIAQLGGFLARKHDGEPGVKTIWQGLRRLHDIAQTWLLVSPTCSTYVKSSSVKKDVSNA